MLGGDTMTLLKKLRLLAKKADAGEMDPRRVQDKHRKYLGQVRSCLDLHRQSLLYCAYISCSAGTHALPAGLQCVGMRMPAGQSVRLATWALRCCGPAGR